MSEKVTFDSIILAVGSKNPVKSAAARNGASKLFQMDNVSVENFDVPSLVSDQPMGDSETLTGATNRARLAYEAYCEAHNGVPPTFSVGLEGGVRDDSEKESLECFAWIVVYNGHFFSKSSTASFLLPRAIKKMIIEDGMELGHADDLLFSRQNSKQSSGSVGLFTHNVIDRAGYYEHAVILAFSPYLWPDLYPCTSNAT
jgi:inosine/xanthosine triphosphatase